MNRNLLSPQTDILKMFEEPTFDSEEDIYFTYEGRIIYDIDAVPADAVLQKHYRIRGGKGGFGSMLRAIGSQIEKTTNHEMCRDLSGRRMRDVNTEKKLKEWYANASERERQKMEEYHQRRQRRKELLEQGPLPGHKFTDRTYERQKRKISYELQTALDSAIESILKESSENKLKPSTSSSTCSVPEHKRARLWIEELDNMSSTDTSSGDENDSPGESDEAKNECENQDPENIPQQSPEDAEQKNETEVEKSCHSQKESDESSESKSLENESRSSAPPKIDAQPISEEDFQNIESVKALETLGLDVLKASLTSRGLKCGGTLQERASRLFSVKGLKPDQYPVKLLAKSK